MLKTGGGAIVNNASIAAAAYAILTASNRGVYHYRFKIRAHI